MNTTQVTFDLPQEIVDEARNAGILDSARVTRLLESEIERQKKIDRFFALIDELHKDDDPDKPSLEEIAEEVRLYRAEKRQKRAAQLAADQHVP